MLFVGIFYVMGFVVQFLRGADMEGFQLEILKDQGGNTVKNCQKTNVFGQDIILCASSNDAQMYLMINANKNYFIPMATQVCYTDSNDAGLINSSNVNYICFQRPQPMTFDMNTNMEREQDPILDDDPQPESNRTSVQGVCGGYQSLLANADIRYTDTSNTFSTVNGIQSAVKYIASGLANVSTMNCMSGTVLSATKMNACGTVSTSIQHFNTLQATAKLNTVSTTLQGSLVNISTLMNRMITTFKNTGCPM